MITCKRCGQTSKYATDEFYHWCQPWWSRFGTMLHVGLRAMGIRFNRCGCERRATWLDGLGAKICGGRYRT